MAKKTRFRKKTRRRDGSAAADCQFVGLTTGRQDGDYADGLRGNGRFTMSALVRDQFKAWWSRNFVNERSGMIGLRAYARAGELDDCVPVTASGRAAWYADSYTRALLDHSERLSADEAAFIVRHPLIAFQLAVGITDLRGLRCYRRGLTAQISRLQRRACRRRYYVRDNARRRFLAAERRRIARRTTTNPCPTPDEFRAAFAAIRESVSAKIRFGSLVHDLECYVDNCLRFNTHGKIVGRNGGIRAWIAQNTPELSARYKTIMRYKALAKRLRQAAKIDDPAPTTVILTSTMPPPTAPAKACRRVHAVLRDCPNTLTALFAAADRLLEDGTENYYAVNSQNRKRNPPLRSGAAT